MPFIDTTHGQAWVVLIHEKGEKREVKFDPLMFAWRLIGHRKVLKDHLFVVQIKNEDPQKLSTRKYDEKLGFRFGKGEFLKTVKRKDVIYIFGHSDATHCGGFTAEALGDYLIKSGLKKVGLICLMGCNLGKDKFPKTLLDTLENGNVEVGWIKAYRGFINVANDLDDGTLKKHPIRPPSAYREFSTYTKPLKHILKNEDDLKNIIDKKDVDARLNIIAGKLGNKCSDPEKNYADQRQYPRLLVVDLEKSIQLSDAG